MLNTSLSNQISLFLASCICKFFHIQCFHLLQLQPICRNFFVHLFCSIQWLSKFLFVASQKSVCQKWQFILHLFLSCFRPKTAIITSTITKRSPAKFSIQKRQLQKIEVSPCSTETPKRKKMQPFFVSVSPYFASVMVFGAFPLYLYLFPVCNLKTPQPLTNILFVNGVRRFLKV